MVKQFKGEVKISDVQNEFDTLLNRINEMIDAYNGTNQVITNIDYTKGGSNLAPSGYTLTVGGIKQALKSLDGHVVGGKCFYNTANTVKMSDGLLFTKGGVFRLPDSILTRPDNGNSIWFDTNKEEYVWGQKRVRGRQTLTEEGATSLIKNGEGYENALKQDGLSSRTSLYWGQDSFKEASESGTTYVTKDDYLTFYNSLVTSSFTQTQGEDEDGNAVYVVSNIKYTNFDLSKYAHKSIPLESTEVEFDIKRSGSVILTEFDEETTTVEWTGKDNRFAMLGYYQDNTFTPYIVIEAHGREGRAAIPQTTPYYTYVDYSHNILNGMPITMQIKSLADGLYYEEHYADYSGDSDPDRVMKDIGAPSGIDTGEHIAYGMRFKLYHPSPYATTEEKANPDNLKGKLVCQLDMLDADDSVIKYYHTYYINSEANQGIAPVPAFVEIWENDKTDGELGSGREKYIAEHSPLGQCNMIIYGTSFNANGRDDGNSVVFKQSEYNPTFNVTTGTYEVWDAQGSPDPDCYHITDYATARDSDYRNDLKNLQVQDVDGTFKITVKDRLFNGIAAAGSSETVDTSSKAKFVCAGDVIRTEGQGVASVSLLGTEVSYNTFPGHRKLNYWYPCNYLYLPKGVSSPYSETNGRPSLMCQFPFEVNIEKDIS